MWWPPPVFGDQRAPITRAAEHLPNWYYVGLVFVVGGFWLAAYILAIREARLSGRNGIPTIACGLNIAWEFNDSLIVNHSSWQRPFNFVWFLLDLIIVSQVLRFGNKDFPEMSKTEYRRFFFLVLAFGVFFIPAVEIEIKDFYGAYTGLGLNCVMSLAFILTLKRRGSSAGQSMYIALSKGVGSALGVVMSVSLYPYSFMVPVMSVTLVTCDVIYTVKLYRQIRREGASPWALTRKPAATAAPVEPVAVAAES